MKRGRATSGLVLAMAGLSACVSPAAAVRPLAEPVAVPVSLNGASFAARIEPGPAGHRFTANGAQPVAGLTVAVAALARDQGKLAKDVAQAACLAQNRRFDGSALGRYASGNWIFNGACA
ncbi:hypothetical protein [Rhodobacter ferrooxidans]|uniref:Lipoprotein n=1 Tax=Rhodobacter ferrooxidans TaxID=371731 RepID=C8RY78_9RHOB|nr:hypothetical protein [Rhodobacter sp. SW2]EEW26476.1 hypothetical protein Rsw2DRAFT_0756 [Rhodobacter sp. SW2]